MPARRRCRQLAACQPPAVISKRRRRWWCCRGEGDARSRERDGIGLFFGEERLEAVKMQAAKTGRSHNNEQCMWLAAIMARQTGGCGAWWCWRCGEVAPSKSDFIWRAPRERGAKSAASTSSLSSSFSSRCQYEGRLINDQCCRQQKYEEGREERQLYRVCLAGSRQDDLAITAHYTAL